MKVFTNCLLSGEVLAWHFRSNRSAKELFLWNNTGKSGFVFNGVSLSFKKTKKQYHVAVNIPHKLPSSKTIGIFVSESGSYVAWEKTADIFSGKSIGGIITGFIGIYKLGSVVYDMGVYYKLTENGWTLHT